jgi:alpha-N-arabinofuranosidase
MIQNPIIAGFYPDPSICRVGEDYYIVNSSFSFFPGVPIFHSKDLTNWEQIGYVLDRKEQLPLTYEIISGGIFAPTIRYHNGIFYMITTNMSMGCVNFVVTATNPAGPWSDMHVIDGADGIDPSLFWDEDGKCYYTGTTRFEDENGNRQAIWCSEIDMEEFQLVRARHIIGVGAQINSASPEGPHIYKKDGYYYLMIAEGGTEHYHAITISRSKDIFGAYENYQGNPILTHRHLGADYPITNTGHGDMVELEDGRWYMVLLGSRLFGGKHKIMGRETFLVPVTWEDGWPIVSKGAGKVKMKYPSPFLYEHSGDSERVHIPQNESMDDFNNTKLGLQWNFLGTPYEEFYRIENSFLKLKLLKNSTVPWEFHNTQASIFHRIQRTGKTKECVSFIGRRQQHMKFEVLVQMEFQPDTNETAGIVILQNDANQIRLETGKDESGNQVVRCIKVLSQIDETGVQSFKEETLGKRALKESLFTFRIIGNQEKYSFYIKNKKKTWVEIAREVDCGFLGSETAGGFVGAYIGMFASGNGVTKEKYAAFDFFSYKGY